MWLIYQWGRGDRWDARRRAEWLQSFAARCLRSIEVEVEAFGKPPIGQFIVSNHLGYLDIIVMASQTPQVFLSQHSVANWPIIGYFVKKAGTLFIDRGRRSEVSNQEIGFAAAIENGVGMTVYLEGTSSDGSEILPFKSSLLDPVVRNGWEVTPAYLRYECEGGDPAVDISWYGDMTFSPHFMNLLALKRVKATLRFGDPRNPGDDRKALALALREEVLALRASVEGP
ncbi:MAG: hypothetical protein CBD18_00510 [Opitutales bacterium TMED158]|nr:MAG: hypothetical protein CBD18_00510 [Opitutales bacterium TMED158]